MKRIALCTLLLLLMTTIAFAHAGEIHTYLGTITKLNKDGSFVIVMPNGKPRTVVTSKATTYRHADGQEANHVDLAVGKRVSAKISKDGKTALNVKLAAVKKPKK